MRDRRSTEPDPHRGRIFGIGLNKTGTSSFDAALEILAFKSLHDGGPAVHEAVRRAINEELPLLSYLDPAYDAFSDIGLLSRRFQLLDRQYPESKFVFTVRPIEQWIDSRRRHVERNLALKKTGDYQGSFLVVDEPKWIREWNDHATRVHRYFETRNNFLEIDLTHGADWTVLCSFLGVAVPSVPFPWENRDRRHRSDQTKS